MPEPVWATLSEAGDADTVNVPTGVTVRFTLAVRVLIPPVPVTVIG